VSAGGYCLVWTLANGQRHANPIARDQVLIEAIASDGNRRNSGTTFAVIPKKDLETWKEQAMDSVTADAPVEELMINAHGDPVPAKFVAGRIRLEDQTVNLLIERAQALQAAMAAFKAEAFSDIHAFMGELSASYGGRRGGTRGGTQLDSYDGLRRVVVSVADSMTFGPELTVAKAMIDDCIRRWSADAKPELKVLIDDAFRVGSEGKVRVDRVIGLRRLDISDDGWRGAMAAIGDALRLQGSVSYIRFYQRESQNAQWKQIPLDMSKL
jgi:hypothetical protein